MLNPRTELAVIAIRAYAATLADGITDTARAALADLGEEAGWTAQHCHPGGPWDHSNLKVALILDDFRRQAVAAGLPPLDDSDPARLLREAATDALRFINRDHRYGRVVQVSFLAIPWAGNPRWTAVQKTVVCYDDGRETYDRFSYPFFVLGRVLDDLAALRPPVPGDRLTLDLVPAPVA